MPEPLQQTVRSMCEHRPELDSIRVLSYNIAKSYVVLDALLEYHKLDYDILFIQELPWQLIRIALSAMSIEDKQVIGAPNHPGWLAIVCPPDLQSPPCIMAYVLNKLSTWRPSM
jgi:hypothetical protein